jgi:hypothetical protein
MTVNRHDRLIQESNHDPYMEKAKRAPCRCPDCGASFRSGRWSWDETDYPQSKQPCAACRRIRDNYPAGIVSIAGDFLREHRAELLGLIHNVETRQTRDHPLSRLMGIEEEDDELVVKTTDIHMARAFGNALYKAYGGTLEGGYVEGKNDLRLHWFR